MLIGFSKGQQPERKYLEIFLLRNIAKKLRATSRNVTKRQISFSKDTRENASSETQGQIVGTRESLNGRENVARRKVKNGEKSRPGDNVLPDQFQTVAAVLPSDWCQKSTGLLAPIRSQNGSDRLELVW